MTLKSYRKLQSVVLLVLRKKNSDMQYKQMQEIMR